MKRYIIRSVGNRYKCVATPIPLKSFYHKRFRSNKLYHNIIRAKKTIFEYAMCNDFSLFFTLTVNDNYNRYDIDSLSKQVVRFFIDIRKKYNLDLNYIIVPEKHKSGAYHFHGLCSDISDDLYLNNYGYFNSHKFDLLGFNNFSYINNKDKSIRYILKYLEKEMDGMFGKHLYYCSKGLKRPQIDYDFIGLSNNSFDCINDYCEFCYFDDLEDLTEFIDEHFINYY